VEGHITLECALMAGHPTRIICNHNSTISTMLPNDIYSTVSYQHLTRLLEVIVSYSYEIHCIMICKQNKTLFTGCFLYKFRKPSCKPSRLLRECVDRLDVACRL